MASRALWDNGGQGQGFEEYGVTATGWRAMTVVVSALLLVGCGGGPSSAASSGSSAEETKSAGQIFTDAMDATGKQQAIHLSVRSTSSSGAVTRIEADITADAASVVSTESSSVTTIVVVGGRSYAKQGGAFVALPAEVNSGLQALTRNKSLSCARVEHGTLTKGEVTRLNGQRVITLRDDGRYPGDAPGTVVVALDGPPLLIRTTTTAPETPGGRADCGHSGSSTTVKQQDDFNYPRSAVTITPPPLSSAPLV